MAKYKTIDFHVTSRCNQECPYCWGPQDFENEVDTKTAIAIMRKIKKFGAQRIVFTGGDPLLRSDIGLLIRFAKQIGLEVALSATGDELTRGFLRAYGRWIDLISLPIDGSNENISSRTKKQGHFQAIMRDLDMLVELPQIDVKLATPVTQYNLADIPAIVHLLDERAIKMPNRLFYNVFQAFPRAMNENDWDEIVVSDEAFNELRKKVEATPHAYRINWLDHKTLDRLYVMIFPDGTLTVPSGPDYLNYGPFLEIVDLEALLDRTDFDAPKHLHHSRGWEKSTTS
ncbi:MAG: radical SAM protein [Anaerolineales bacterium]|nr:radical SAM protein [Anaerolineales bacterium]